MSCADVDGLALWHEENGSGDPPILLHGGMGAAEMFDPILDQLAAGRRVITVDLPGHGHIASPRAPVAVLSQMFPARAARPWPRPRPRFWMRSPVKKKILTRRVNPPSGGGVSLLRPGESGTSGLFYDRLADGIRPQSEGRSPERGAALQQCVTHLLRGRLYSPAPLLSPASWPPGRASPRDPARFLGLSDVRTTDKLERWQGLSLLALQ